MIVCCSPSRLFMIVKFSVSVCITVSMKLKGYGLEVFSFSLNDYEYGVLLSCLVAQPFCQIFNVSSQCQHRNRQK